MSPTNESTRRFLIPIFYNSLSCYCSFIVIKLPFLLLHQTGSTHQADIRATSNPSSPSSSPHITSVLDSGSSDPVLNGGLCSAAYCSSAEGKYTQRGAENQSPYGGSVERSLKNWRAYVVMLQLETMTTASQNGSWRQKNAEHGQWHHIVM